MIGSERGPSTFIATKLLELASSILDITIVKLALACKPIERLTRSTTSRASFRIHFSSSTSKPFHSRSYSTPRKPSGDDDTSGKTSEQGQKTVLGALKDLLGFQLQGKASPAEEPRKEKIRTAAPRLVAEFTGAVRTYINETPTDRWRERAKLKRDRSVVNGTNESETDQVRAEAVIEEVIFRDRHRERLIPHQPPFLRQYIRPDHISAYKMRSFVQIITTPTADTPGTTLLLHFDNKRYLVGSLAEGTQRACVQMGARLLKVSECFLTGRTEWTNTGGLIGMILTLADSSAASQASSVEEALKKARSKAARLGVLDDAGKMQQLEDAAKREASNTLSIFGPPNLNHTLATARRYVFRKGMPVNIHEIRTETAIKEGEDQWSPFWADENIKVWAMSILPARDPKSQSYGTTCVSPRKRSIDEVYASENGATIESYLSPEDRNYLTVKAVVSEMFNSSWRLDTLYETSLSDVKLPATIFIRNPDTNKIQKYTGPLPSGPKPVPDPHLKVLVRKPWPGALVESLPPTEPAKEAVSYIIRNHMQRGKFRPEKAKQLKVKEGKSWATLAKGESVQSEDGQTITPEMVLDPSRVGGGLAVVDLPGPDYIENLVSRPEWREPKVMEGVGAIMWICGKGVAQDSRLQAFMKEFSALEHVVSSPEYCPNRLSLDSVAASTVRLKQVDPDRYGVPVHDTASSDTQTYGGNSDFEAVRRDQPLPDGVHIADRGQVIQLEPSIEFQTKETVPLLKVAEAAAEVPAEVMEEAVKAQEAIKVPDEEVQRWRSTLPPSAENAEVITLGTGSALPSKYRNVSATLVRVPEWGNILLDAGENTLGQLKRVFTPDELKDVLQNLRMIVISHMHADHQLGTTSIVKAWYEEVHDSRPATLPANPDFEQLFESNYRLAVVSEPAMQSWLAEYSAVEDYGYSRLAPLALSPGDPFKDYSSKLNWFVPPADLKNLSQAEYQSRLNANTISPSLLNLADIQAVQVRHCHGARAVSITLPSGFKVSYSGDCRPSRPFSEIGKDSTVCIHEATFDDELQGDAQAKNHSTTSEALEVAQRMKAKACVLTHFSQRYQKVPVLERAEDEEPDEIEDVSMNSASSSDNNAEDLVGEDTAAATFPDQEASGTRGQQVDLPPASKQTGGEAVRFKLKSDMKVCVAFDYMRVKVGDIVLMEKFTPALLRLFAEEEKEMAERVAKTSETKAGKSKKKKDGKGG